MYSGGPLVTLRCNCSAVWEISSSFDHLRCISLEGSVPLFLAQVEAYIANLLQTILYHKILSSGFERGSGHPITLGFDLANEDGS